MLNVVSRSSTRRMNLIPEGFSFCDSIVIIISSQSCSTFTSYRSGGARTQREGARGKPYIHAVSSSYSDGWRISGRSSSPPPATDASLSSSSFFVPPGRYSSYPLELPYTKPPNRAPLSASITKFSPALTESCPHIRLVPGIFPPLNGKKRGSPSPWRKKTLNCSFVSVTTFR